MARFLSSGLRRDICAVLAEHGELTGQKCKARLRDHYEDRIKPDQFYGALEALVDRGFVARSADGIHDTYALTEAGERAVRAHYEWLREAFE